MTAARIYFFIAIAFFLSILLMILVDAEWVKSQIDIEQGYIAGYLGDEKAKMLRERTDAIFAERFVENEVVDKTYRFFLFNESTLTSAAKGLAPASLLWIRDRIEAMWWLIYESIFRYQMTMYWLPFVLPLMLAAMLDGFMQRQIRKYEQGYASPAHHTTATALMVFLWYSGFLYMAIPIAIHPLFIPVWAMLMIGNIALFSSSMQNRI